MKVLPPSPMPICVCTSYGCGKKTLVISGRSQPGRDVSQSTRTEHEFADRKAKLGISGSSRIPTGNPSHDETDEQSTPAMPDFTKGE